MVASQAVFHAISDPTRRRILDLVAEGERPVGELVAAFRISQPAVSQHLKVLREAGLVAERRDGRQRRYRITPEPLREVADLARPLPPVLEDASRIPRAPVGRGAGQMTESIRYEFHLKHPPAKVWAAITSSEQMAKWLMPNDFAPVLGHRFTFRRDPMPALNFDGISHCEVIALEPPRQLAFTLRGGALDTKVTFELEPEAGGTLLRFEHSGFDLADPRQEFSFKAMGGGWAKLGDTLDGLIAKAA